MTANGLESSGTGSFRDWVRGRWMGWIDGREPAGGRGQRRSGWGSGRGAPDLTLGVSTSIGMPSIILPLPVELKRARFTHGTKLTSESAVNEDQVKWHRLAASKGVLTAFMWGIPAGDGWRMFIMRPNDGWAALGDYTELAADPIGFNRGVRDWVAGQLKL